MREKATLSSPVIDLGDGVTKKRNIAVLGVGYSPSTMNSVGEQSPFTAPIIVVKDYDELETESEVR